MKPIRPLIVAILDGWGLAKPGPSNAISIASTPNMDSLMKNYPATQLVAYGEAVGLSGSTTGNSEVGHINIGAGYVVPQSEVRISQSIADKSFNSNESLLNAIMMVKKRKSNLHIIGLGGPGMVHSNIDHLWALLALTKIESVESVYVHLISDGRDASPQWMGKNAVAVQTKIESYGAQLASVCGRYYMMDRDNRWERIEQAYMLLTEKRGQIASTLDSALQSFYQDEVTDEFIKPTVIGNGKVVASDDVVIMFNYRPDRARQLAQALCLEQFEGFARPNTPSWDVFTFTSYQDDLPVSGVAFPSQKVAEPLAKVISDAKLTQLHAAESEKYAHVTYFLNGGEEKPFSGEERLLVASPKVATYDLKPEMSAPELTKKVCNAIDSGKYNVIFINYANADMVAHTGSLAATVTAIESVDECIGQLFTVISRAGGVLAITADHGNAEVLINSSGYMDTQHNSGVVPFIIAGDDISGELAEGSLANVAPTLLEVIGIPKPLSMTSESLWRGDS